MGTERFGAGRAGIALRPSCCSWVQARSWLRNEPWQGVLPWERGAVLAVSPPLLAPRSSTKPFRAAQPRGIFTRYLRSINMSAPASYRDLLLSAPGGDGSSAASGTSSSREFYDPFYEGTEGQCCVVDPAGIFLG